MSRIRLGINVDHVATLRNARGGSFPCPVEIIALFKQNRLDIDLITLHLRQDRRHIKDNDLFRIKRDNIYPINLEMGATEEMLEIALDVKPDYVCLVPEKREELTTEGGLDLIAGQDKLVPYIEQLNKAAIKVSLFIEPSPDQVIAAQRLKAYAVELHTGSYSNKNGNDKNLELTRIRNAARLVKELGMSCHAGHGLDYENVPDIAKIREIEELNIGHFLIGRAIYDGICPAIEKMRRIIDQARNG